MVQKVAKTGSKFTSAKSPNKRREREEMLSRTMKLLEHASSCNSKACQSKSCRKVKRLHAHARVCEQKVSGGCALCKHMWCLLNLHAKQCVKRECPVPRCQCAPLATPCMRGRRDPAPVLRCSVIVGCPASETGVALQGAT